MLRYVLFSQVRAKFEDLDLAYSAGLCDYLADANATRLTRVLIAIFAPSLPILD
jgi:hypothetical protein